MDVLLFAASELIEVSLLLNPPGWGSDAANSPIEGLSKELVALEWDLYIVAMVVELTFFGARCSWVLAAFAEELDLKSFLESAS